MRLFTKYVNLIKYTSFLAMLVTALLIFVCVPGLGRYEEEGTNTVSVFINGMQVGTVRDASNIGGLVNEARRRLAKESSELVLVDCNLVVNGSKDVVGQVDDDETIVKNIYSILKTDAMKTKQPAYEVKINEKTLNLGSIEDVVKLLETAKAEYDQAGEWKVKVVSDTSRELDVYKVEIEKHDNSDVSIIEKSKVFPRAGALLAMEDIYNAAFTQNIDNTFEFGTKSLGFAEKIEVVHAYVDPGTIVSLEDAISEITMTQDRSKIYEVISGDTLGQIAEKNSISVDELLKLNPISLPNEEAIIREGQELTIYSPEPELSVKRIEREYYEENYDAQPQYIDVPEWYTNQTEVIQQPVTGFRKVVADVTYRNMDAIYTDILYENVEIEAVAKIVKRGTKVPPSYIYPVSGRISSGFGKRKAPKKGASTYHKGIDFAVPIGTAIVASSGGTVLRAGWGSGYGYCVYIQHPDGKVTRYGHCSKVLVKAGQTVTQGQKIALSGNTGVSTGPHLHFEILVGGGQVNPMNYIN